MPLHAFHPTVSEWFASRFGAPTEAQLQAWPAIRSGQHTLIAAPTGSGKTLAAFLAGPNAGFITGQCYGVNGGSVMT